MSKEPVSKEDKIWLGKWIAETVAEEMRSKEIYLEGKRDEQD